MWLFYNRKHETIEWAFLTDDGKIIEPQRVYGINWLQTDTQWRHWAGQRTRDLAQRHQWKDYAKDACIAWAKSVKAGKENGWLKTKGLDEWVTIEDEPVPHGEDGETVEDGDAVEDGDETTTTDSEDETVGGSALAAEDSGGSARAAEDSDIDSDE